MLAFHPELFDAKAKAQQALENAGFRWLSDYSTCDVLHDEYGLEVEGLADQKAAQEVRRVLRRTFPQWKLSCIWYRETCDARWCVSLSKLRRACG